MLLHILSLKTNTRQRGDLWYFLNITNTTPLHCCTLERPGAPAHTLVSSSLYSVGSVHQQSSHSWMGILTSHSPPNERALCTNRGAAWVGPPSSRAELNASLGSAAGRRGGETAGILLSAVSQWEARELWYPAAVRCDWFKALLCGNFEKSCQTIKLENNEQ